MAVVYKTTWRRVCTESPPPPLAMSSIAQGWGLESSEDTQARNYICVWATMVATNTAAASNWGRSGL